MVAAPPQRGPTPLKSAAASAASIDRFHFKDPRGPQIPGHLTPSFAMHEHDGADVSGHKLVLRRIARTVTTLACSCTS